LADTDNTGSPEDETAVLAEWERQLVNEAESLTTDTEDKTDTDAATGITEESAESPVSEAVKPEPEAEIPAEWEQQLKVQDEAAITEREESEPDLAAPDTNEPEAVSDTESVDHENEAAMLAEWEQQLVNEAEIQTDAPDAAVQQGSPQGEGFVAFSETQATQIADKERAEADREAALAAAWQTASTETVQQPTMKAPSEQEQPGEEASGESEDEDIDTGPPVKLTDAKAALSEMWDDLTEEPLPSEEDLESMFNEIRQLDQNQPTSNQESRSSNKATEKDELKSILSSIPSFSQMNKKSDH
jgi:hypothetical protein